MADHPFPRLAVALAYDIDEPGAPRVVAKGRGLLAQQIVALAEESGVPLEENAALAEALERVELDEEIPEALFAAVAAIIAYVLRASGRL